MKIRQIDIKGERYDIEAFTNPIPVGTVLHFAGSTAPEGFLFTEGQEVSRSAYPSLFAVIGTKYGEGDGKTTFNLPDYREVVFVGAGQNVKLDIKAHDVYELGEFKDDQFQGHWHLINGLGENTTGRGGVYYEPERIEDVATAKKIVTDNENGTPRVGSTTHGKQVGVNYIIKV